MSRNVLNEESPHTYLDDLESFFYVLCWILVTFKGPGKTRKVTPQLIALWDDIGAPEYKHGHFMLDFKFLVDPWFGACFRDLATSLFRFFKRRRKYIGKPLSSLHPTRDYDDYISHVRKCITDMEIEDRGAEHHSPPLAPGLEGSHVPDEQARRKRRQDDADVAAPPPAKRRLRTLSRPMTPPLPRPRRSNANYGEEFVSPYCG